MKIVNAVTYTQYSPAYKAHIEQTARLVRDRKLTTVGAQRILRQQGINDAVVTRLEAIGAV